MNEQPPERKSQPVEAEKETPATPGDLRQQIDHTREELGRTVEQLAAKADVKAQAQRRATALKEQARERTTRVTDLVRDRTPEPVREKAVQAIGTTRDHRGPVIAVSTVLLALWLIQRSRRRR